MIKVSFDYDGTLTEPEVQVFCRKLIKKKVEVWITTLRNDDETEMLLRGRKRKDIHSNEPLFDLATKLDIPHRRIIFTNSMPKSAFLMPHNFVFHLDDDPHIITEIEQVLPFLCINVCQRNWQKNCLEAIGF